LSIRNRYDCQLETTDTIVN